MGQPLAHLLVHAIFPPKTAGRSCIPRRFGMRSILNQAEHDRKISYQEEIREIFKRHRVAFDERYVWD